MENNRLKLGILAPYLTTRNDIRSLINEISNNFQVTLYLKKSDVSIKKNLKTQIRTEFIMEKYNKYQYYILNVLYKLFGEIPESKNNYFVTEHFKISNSGYKPIHRFIELFLLKAARITPKFISYDRFLNLLPPTNTLAIEEQDIFFCCTHIYDDVLFKEIVPSRKKVFVYVYSWDHPCKMKCFSKNSNVYYLVWSRELKTDLVTLHGISQQNIYILGSTQFIYLHQFLKNKPIVKTDASVTKYLYIVMATGTQTLAPQEIKLFSFIAKKIKELGLTEKVLIRPYPFLKDWSVYDSLREVSNVQIEDDYRENPHSKMVSEENLSKKYKIIENASLLIHCGTTLGLEASYLNIPVLFIDFSLTFNLKQLDKFIHQYQNDKYLNLEGFPNVSRSLEEFEKSLIACLQNSDDFLPYNAHCKNVAEIKSLSEITAALTELMNNNSVSLS